MISNMRYTHLINEAGTLLARLRMLGASFEDLNRANSLLDHSTPQAIGAIIHDLQSQLHDLELFNFENGIDPHHSDLFDLDCLEERAYGD